MSILIKGIEMPKSCEECRFFTWSRGIGQRCDVDDRITFHAIINGFDVGYERNGDCPLVEVPPSVYVRPVKRGKWMHKEITADFHVVGQCSVCKERRVIDNYCPNCGAHMREES